MSRYRGRFAPSPTGPLHFGSLVAALGSCLDARQHGGEWLVRMEDLDRPREVAGAADAILRSLEEFGFEWDGSVAFQSTRAGRYETALARLNSDGLLFACSCTRKELADSMGGHALSRDTRGRDRAVSRGAVVRGAAAPARGAAAPAELVYPGTCRNGLAAGRLARALRLRTTGLPIEFDDAIQGHISQNVAAEVGDFLLRRADGLFAYQLAVVVDDAEQGVTEVVRGADLLDSTPRQIYLQRLLGFPEPRYAHLPVAVNAAGEKLSKQTLATPLDSKHAPAALYEALRFLGQAPPAALRTQTLQAVWKWARRNWSLARVPRQRALPAPRGM